MENGVTRIELEQFKKKFKIYDEQIDSFKILNNKYKGVENSVIEIAKRLDAVTESLKNIIRSVNSCNLVVGCMEEHLDDTAKDWDKGRREVVKKTQDKLIEKQRYVNLALAKHTEDYKRVDYANKIWKLSHELGTELQDVISIIKIYSQAKDMNKLRLFVHSLDAYLPHLGEPEREFINEVKKQLKITDNKLRLVDANSEQREGASSQTP